jgi:bifunctional UDP-N-acetylglucosamine pyrophosphorylase/glucosamine-1-phosphate N-acetyltransferase
MTIDQLFLAVVIAAGRSSRFKGPTNKLLALLCGRPLVFYPLKALSLAGLPINIVVGAQSDFLKQSIKDTCVSEKISFSHQLQPVGTGDAVACSRASWGTAEHILVINGDMPLITPELIKNLMTHHVAHHAAVSFVTSNVLNPTGYGRVIVDVHGTRIVEEKDCTPEERSVSRINAGIYAFRRDFLESTISSLSTNNASGEFYLTDLVRLASLRGHVVTTINAPFETVQGVNTLEEFWIVEQILRTQLVRQWTERGVHFESPSNMHVDVDVHIGQNTRIGTGVLLLRGTIVGADCTISPFSILAHATIGNSTSIKSHTVIQDSLIGSECVVGPFVRIRNNTIVKDNATIESFVELSACTLGKGVVINRMCCLEDRHIDAHSIVNHQASVASMDGQADFFLDESAQQQQL